MEYAAALLATLKIRAVPVNVNYRYVEAELAYLYRDSDIVALLFDIEFDDDEFDDDDGERRMETTD